MALKRYNGILKLGDIVPSFRMVWDTRNISEGSSNDSQVRFPLKGSGQNLTINWGDGTVDTNITQEADARLTHTFPAPGIYETKVTGVITNFGFNNSGDKLKALRVLEFGPLSFVAGAAQVFYGCANLDITASDLPNTSLVTNFSNWFRGCENLIWNNTVSGLDTSSGTNFNAMFRGCRRFNKNTSTFNMSLATDIGHMYNGCWIFNQPIGNYNITSACTNAEYILNECFAFNQNLNSWDVSGVTSLQYALRQTALTTGISSWRPTSCLNIDHMLEEAVDFNDSLGDWNMPVLQSATRAFSGCKSYDNPLFTATNPTLTNISYMLNLCGNFTDKNKNLENLNVSSVENFGRALQGTTKLNPNLSNWNIESGIDFTNFMGEISGGYSMSIENYDKLLASWSEQDVQSGVNITFSGIKYKDTTSRSALIGKGWTINDGGLSNIDESIVLRYEFDEGFPDFVRDKSYYGNHGILQRPDLALYENSPINGLALIIAGIGTGTAANSKITIPTSDSLQSVSEEFTIDFYIRGNKEINGGQTFFTTYKNSTSNGIDISSISGSPPNTRFQAWLNYSDHGNTYRIETSPSTEILEYSNYNRLTLTYDSENFKIFYNKVLGTYNSSISTPTPLSVMSVLDWEIFHKAFDNFTVYNRALTDQEVGELTDEI